MSLLRMMAAARSREGAAQRRLDPLGQRGEVRLAVERNENGAAHQRGAAQAGENRAGEPLNGNAAAIDQSDRRAVHQQWRFVAEIDRLSGWSQTIWIAPSALIQAPCPLPLAVTRLRRGPPQVPSLCSTERIAPWRTASALRQRACSTSLRDSYCDHRPFPECEQRGRNVAPVRRRARLRRSGVGRNAVHSAKLRRFLRLSVLTRVGGGPYKPPHNGAPSAFGAMARLRSSSPMV